MEAPLRRGFRVLGVDGAGSNRGRGRRLLVPSSSHFLPLARSVKLAALGTPVGVREVGHRGAHAVEQSRHENPAGVVRRPLDIRNLRLGSARRRRQLDLLQVAIFTQRAECPTEQTERVGRVGVDGARPKE